MQEDRKLVQLQPAELDAIVPIRNGGEIDADADALAKLISRVIRLVGVRVGVSGADYYEDMDRAAEPSTRSANGIWWLPHGDDTALIGGFVVDGLAMTVTTEGEGEAPLAEGVEILDRATKAIASQHEGAVIVEPGLFEVPFPAGVKPVRLVVTRDHRIRRPQDALSADEFSALETDRLAFVIVQLIGGEKALVVKHRI